MKRCTQYGCCSYTLNLHLIGIDSHGLCDVHYWQDRALKAEADLLICNSAAEIAKESNLAAKEGGEG